MDTETIYIFGKDDDVYFSFTSWGYNLPLIGTRRIAYVDGKIYDTTEPEDEAKVERIREKLTEYRGGEDGQRSNT